MQKSSDSISYSPPSSLPSRVRRRARRLGARLFLCVAMYVLAPPPWRSSAGRGPGSVRRRVDDLRVIALDAVSGIGRTRRYLRPLDAEQRDANGLPLGPGASTESEPSACPPANYSDAWSRQQAAARRDGVRFSCGRAGRGLSSPTRSPASAGNRAAGPTRSTGRATAGASFSWRRATGADGSTHLTLTLTPPARSDSGEQADGDRG